MEEDINYSPTVMFRGTPCISLCKLAPFFWNSLPSQTQILVPSYWFMKNVLQSGEMKTNDQIILIRLFPETTVRS